jgi:hypothetical protein
VIFPQRNRNRFYINWNAQAMFLLHRKLTLPKSSLFGVQENVRPNIVGRGKGESTVFAIGQHFSGHRLALARSSGTYLRYRDKLARPDVVIIDDFGMRKLSATEAQDPCELLEERSINKSTIFTTQLPLDHWNEVIADSVIADAIRDRLEHSALTLHITGESYRGVKARKLANKKKDS